MKKTILFLVITLFLLETALSAHFIVGYVEDALNSEPANGKTITLWNPTNGQNDNVTDIIGPTGNSGANNIYMIDCELLNTPCVVNDVLSIKIINNGDDNVSEIVNVTVTGLGFDQAGNITLNSPPIVNLSSPLNYINNSGELTFNCSFFDHDDNINNVSLWGNWTGSWIINETQSVSPGDSYKIFSKNISEGKYNWTCSVNDNLSIQRFALENRTFTIDNSPPTIASVLANVTTVCAGTYIRVNCTATDTELSIDTVIIQSILPNNTRTNNTASLLTGNTYFYDIIPTVSGNWSFNCFANDTAGNTNNLTSSIVDVDPEDAELFLSSDYVYVNKTPEIENEAILITANISNLGCTDATPLLVGYYNGDKDSGGTGIQNVTSSISNHNSQNISIIWPAEIGLNNIFIYADINTSYSEENESNNDGNLSLYLQAWQEIFGNTTINKILANFLTENITQWQNHSDLQGNVFISDSESSIDWYSLHALGRNTTNDVVSNDFTELDTSLSMTSLNDSVYNTFTNSGTPIKEQNYSLFGYTIQFVPSINSTINPNFVTGILWDTSDDSNSQYDSSEQEDIVFVAKVNKSSIGKYGVYDYEMRVPARLREYNATDTSDLFFYYEIN